MWSSFCRLPVSVCGTVLAVPSDSVDGKNGQVINERDCAWPRGGLTGDLVTEVLVGADQATAGS